MKRSRGGSPPAKVDLQMTPMIDIVFQLLIFFIMSFKIAVPEGDFSIRMPQPGPTEPHPQLPPTLTVKLSADDAGELSGVQVNGVTLSPPFKPALRFQALALADRSAPRRLPEGAQVELECDYNLKYEHAMMAITAVSGYLEAGQVHRLIEKIKFTPPKKPS